MKKKNRLTDIALARNLKLRYEETKDHAPRSEHEDLKIIPCARGGEGAHIYQFGPGVLAFTGRVQTVRRELLGIPGAKAHQTGDEEYTILFPEKVFDAVSICVRPRRKRVGDVTRLKKD